MLSTPPPCDRYEITSELGRGGMGVVYAALDRQRNEEVAIKRLLTERFANEHERTRATTLFEREYHTLSQLAHPRIIHVFDYGLDAQGPFYTMERLRGRSLRECAPLDWIAAAGALRDVASALAIVHARRLVHRDVTPRNIYLDADGGGKLIDFGAMIPAGIAKQLVGTPNYIAPECLHSQPLDGRTDLFALGASLYFALSGRNAYPAHDLAALEAAWRTSPLPLSQLVAGTPDELDELVLSLLSLAPASRPRTAADVYERLSSIAGLPRSEHAQVGHAYLTTPALVGRAEELAVVRELAERAVAGRGSSILLEGPAGFGRTRLLDAAILEARLRGMRVARADASDAQAGPLGVVARLLQTLAADGGEVEPLLRSLELDPLLQSERSALVAEGRRERTLRDLSQVLGELVKRTPIALGIDDLQYVDEPSLAVLASVAVGVRRRSLLLLWTLDETMQRHSNALRVVREASKRLSVGALDSDQSRALLSAIFGEVPNLDVLAALLQAHCSGSPRRAIDGAQALIAAGLVVYEGGTWVLSGDAGAIAATLDARTDVAVQVAALSTDARELLEVLSLDRAGGLTLADYAPLTAHGDSARMHRALSELIEAQWLDLAGDRTRFRRADQQRQIAQRLPEDRSRPMHGRLAERYVRLDLAPIYAAHHFIRAEQWERALLPMDEMSRFVEANGSADAIREPVSLETLEAFSLRADIPGAHPSARANYAAAFVTNAMYQGLPDRAAPRIRDAVESLAHYTGLADYRALSHLPESERLTRALQRAAERCQEPGIGGLDLIRMIRRQTQLALTAAVCANFMADPSILQTLPDLSPFAPLSPALAIAVRIADGIAMVARGQSWKAWDTFADARARIAALPAGAIDSLTMIALELPVLGYRSALEAEHASPDTLAHLDEYAQRMRHHAESIRARYFFAIGDPARSAAARQTCELLSVQSNSLSETRTSELVAYLSMYALSDDLLRLRHLHAALLEVVKTRPGWHFRAALARAHIARCRGNFEEGLEVLREPLRSIPRDHADFVALAAGQIELSIGARRFDQALRLGETYLEDAKQSGAPAFRLELGLARTHAELGHHEWAEARLASAAHALESRGVAGILLGRLHETGARVAIARGDAVRFAERSAACAHHYAVQQNGPLAVVYARLLRDAARRGVGAGAELDLGSSGVASAIRKLAAVTSDSDFYARALELVVEYAGAAGGLLYARTSEGLRRVATTSGLRLSAAVDPDREAERYFVRARQQEDESTAPGAGAPAKEVAPVTPSGGSGAGLYPYLLPRRHEQGNSIEGVVLLAMAARSASLLSIASLDQLATLMMFRAESATTASDMPPDSTGRF